MSKVDSTKVSSIPADSMYVGKKYSDAYSKAEAYELFNYADKNNDNVLDEEEIRRYRGPLLVVEKEDKTKKQYFKGEINGHICRYKLHGDINAKMVTPKEFEFYPGVKFSDNADSDFKLVFSGLDLNRDNILSKEEMQTYDVYADKKYKQQQIIDENEDNKTNNFIKSIFGGIGGAAALLFGLCPGVEKIAELIALKKYTSAMYTGKTSKVLRNMASGKYATAIDIAGVILGVGAGLLATKYLWHKKQKPIDESQELKAQDRQYKNVYNPEKED